MLKFKTIRSRFTALVILALTVLCIATTFGQEFKDLTELVDIPSLKHAENDRSPLTSKIKNEEISNAAIETSDFKGRLPFCDVNPMCG